MNEPAHVPFVPGQIVVSAEPLDIGGDPDLELMVANTGDRPIQVGSHFHFAEVNRALAFDRDAAWGHRLALPAGTAVRFEPGIERLVALTPLRGRRVVPGLRGAAAGPLDRPGERPR
ncbi:MAG TPA: urease subunit beta [Acidimicrobiales bacterium]